MLVLALAAIEMENAAHQPVEIVRLSYMYPVGGLGRLANSLVCPKSLDPDAMNGEVRLFDRFAIPISKGLAFLFRSFFGQSVTCIARRT